MPTLLLVDQIFFAERATDRCRCSSFPILDVSIRSGDIRGRSLKLSEIAPEFCTFLAPVFLWTAPNFGTQIIKLKIGDLAVKKET